MQAEPETTFGDTLILPGRPMTMARVRFKRNGPAYTPKERVLRQGDFAEAWISEGLPKFEGPIAFEVEFVFDRPRGHYGTGRNADLVKASAPSRPGAGAGGGDLDNLVKLPMDALAGIAFRDDSQIARLIAEKRYARPDETPHSRIRIHPLTAP